MQILHLIQYRRCQHRRTSTVLRCEKTGHPLFSIEFHATQHRDFTYPEGPADLGLAGAAIDVQLTCEHPEARHIVNGVREHQKIPVYVGERGVFTDKTDILVDKGQALREDGELKLRHGNCPMRGIWEIGFSAIISKSAAVANCPCGPFWIFDLIPEG